MIVHTDLVIVMARRTQRTRKGLVGMDEAEEVKGQPSFVAQVVVVVVVEVVVPVPYEELSSCIDDQVNERGHLQTQDSSMEQIVIGVSGMLAYRQHDSMNCAEVRQWMSRWAARTGLWRSHENS